MWSIINIKQLTWGFCGKSELMIRVRLDYNGFYERYYDYLSKKYPNLELDVDIVDQDKPEARVCDVSGSPFGTNPKATFSGVYQIAYNLSLIEKCGLTQLEADALILHEIGHLIHKTHTDRNTIEILCDRVAVDAKMSLAMLSALYKMHDKLGIILQDRIEALLSTLCIYRPVWTCGRYNEGKRVAIMYNLIAGFSYFFNEFSADVIGEILKTGRNGKVSITTIADRTGICMESLCQFYLTLMQCGLLTETMPTEIGVQNYRKIVFEAKKANQAWVDKITMEKLPMNVTNAEQSYFDAVDDGKTICSCMFELTYRCSEMCIHCYNPGATRNNEEVSHRGDFKELSLADYKRIIDEMYDCGLVKVCLSGGDPFSKEFVWELLDYLYNKGIAIYVFTNGQRLTKDVKRLADYFPRSIGVSIYSGVAEDHDVITRIPGSWKKSMQVVKELYELAVPMNLKCCVMQPNLHSYYMVADIAKEYGAIPQFEINISESNDGDVCAKQLRLTEEQLHIVLRDNNLALYVGKEAPNYGGQKRDISLCSCGAGGTGFCMSPNGDLRACTAFSQVYGNLQKESVYKILSDSPVLQEWRNAVVADYIECGKYPYCDYCNLCAGLNYAEHGDYRIPAETNCFMAKSRYNLACKLMEYGDDMTRDEFIKAVHRLPTGKYDLKRKYRTKG